MSNDEKRYLIQRHGKNGLVTAIADLTHLQMVGIVTIVWGVVPNELLADQGGGELDKDVKLHMGGWDWIIVRRVK